MLQSIKPAPEAIDVDNLVRTLNDSLDIDKQSISLKRSNSVTKCGREWTIPPSSDEMTTQQISELRNRFQLIGGDGEVDFEKFRQGLGESVSESVAWKVFDFLDSNRNGSLSFDEFISGITALVKAPWQVQARLVFHLLDKDGSGTLSVDELEAAIMRAISLSPMKMGKSTKAKLTEGMLAVNLMNALVSTPAGEEEGVEELDLADGLVIDKFIECLELNPEVRPAFQFNPLTFIMGPQPVPEDEVLDDPQDMVFTWLEYIYVNFFPGFSPAAMVWVVAYVVVSIWLAVQAVQYQRSIGSSFYFQIAKTGGANLHFHNALLAGTMLRISSVYLGQFPRLAELLPLAVTVPMHRGLGMMNLLWMTVHVVGHSLEAMRVGTATTLDGKMAEFVSLRKQFGFIVGTAHSSGLYLLATALVIYFGMLGNKLFQVTSLPSPTTHPATTASTTATAASAASATATAASATAASSTASAAAATTAAKTIATGTGASTPATVTTTTTAANTIDSSPARDVDTDTDTETLATAADIDIDVPLFSTGTDADTPTPNTISAISPPEADSDSHTHAPTVTDTTVDTVAAPAATAKAIRKAPSRRLSQTKLISPPPKKSMCPFQRLQLTFAFELGQYSHWLVLSYYAVCVIHAPWAWKCLVGPVGLLLIEWAIRFRRRNSPTTLAAAEKRPCKLTVLEVKRPSWMTDWQSGAYVFVNIPEIAMFEWHPFTISNSCEQSLSTGTFTLHVKTALSPASWSARLAALADDVSKGKRVLSDIKVYVDGPYGAPSQQVFACSHAVLVAGGIGITPASAIIDSALWKHKLQSISGTTGGLGKLKRLDVLWVHGDLSCTEWFTSLLADIEEQTKMNEDLNRLIHIRIFLTQVPKDASGDELAVHLAVDAMVGGPSLLTHHTFQQAMGKRRPGGGDIEQGLAVRKPVHQLPVHAGRPDWHAVMTDLKAVSPDSKDMCAFFCGPPAMGLDLARACSSHGIKFRQEVF